VSGGKTYLFADDTRGAILGKKSMALHFATAPALLKNCVEICLRGSSVLEPVGFYGAHDAGFFESRGGSTHSIRDFGPLEFSANFHNLWIFSAANAMEKRGPIMTFADSDYGFFHALEQAHSDMEEGRSRSAVITYLSLQNLPGASPKEEYAVSLHTSSPAWLQKTIVEVSSAGPNLTKYFTQLFQADLWV